MIALIEHSSWMNISSFFYILIAVNSTVHSRCQQIFSHRCVTEKLGIAGNANAIRGRDREEISTPVEATNRRPKRHRLRFIQSANEFALFFVTAFLRLRAIFWPRWETWASLKLLQKYDVQLDQRNLLRFVLSPDAELPSSPGPRAYLSWLPKCAY